MSERLLSGLNRLLAACEASGTRLGDSLLPGIAEETVRERLRGIGLEPPADLRVLLVWPNGSDRSRPPYGFFGPSLYFRSLDEACEMYKLVSQFLPARARRGEIEHARWFPVIDFSGGPVVMDCQVGSPNAGCVFGCSFDDDIPPFRPGLIEPIERWASYVESGSWRWERDDWTDYREGVTRDAEVTRGNLP